MTVKSLYTRKHLITISLLRCSFEVQSNLYTTTTLKNQRILVFVDRWSLLINDGCYRVVVAILRWSSASVLVSGVDFTNIFSRNFCARRSQKHKKTAHLTVFFTLLGSAGVKVVCRTLMKLAQKSLSQHKQQAYVVKIRI